MSFGDDLRIFAAKVHTNNQAVFVNTCAAAKDSITDGSPTTGAPGQLVDTGNLKASWQLEFESASSALISTNVEYAQQMEEGTRDGRALVQRSQVGGFHSVALTVAGLDKIVALEAEKVANA